MELDGISVAVLWDEPTGSWQYILIDRATSHAAIIDPALDFDPMSGATATRNADAHRDADGSIAGYVALNRKEEWIRSIDFSNARAGLDVIAQQFANWAPYLTNFHQGQ